MATSLARSPEASLRLEDLYEISTLFLSFKGVEQAVDRVLAIIARTLPPRSAILIVGSLLLILFAIWDKNRGRAP